MNDWSDVAMWACFAVCVLAFSSCASTMDASGDQVKIARLHAEVGCE